MKTPLRVAVIVPAYNEGRVIRDVLRSFQKEFSRFPNHIQAQILVINDGSTDNTSFEANLPGIRVVTHLLNLGLGGAISTGLKIARDEGFDAAVTADSDGQHTATDIRKIAEELAKRKTDFVVGSRWLKKSTTKDNVPLIRRLGNKYVMNSLTLIFTSFKTTDSQSGLRGFSRQALEKIELLPQRMEVSTEIFSQVKKHRLRYREVPIEAIYTDYSRSKGQRTLNGLNILWRLTISRLL